jgi:hypothetical protein
LIISDAQPIITFPSESSELIQYVPQPHNLLECINVFGYNASKQVSELMTSTSTNPLAVRKDWEKFQKWMQSTFQYMHQFSESDKLASIQAAAARREVHEHSVADRLAKQRRIAAEMEALAEAERLEFMRAEAELVQVAEEREEEERAEAESLEAEWLEARRAEAARQEVASAIVILDLLLVLIHG